MTSNNQNNQGLVKKFANKFSINENRLLDILKSTAFKQRNGTPPTNEQMAALLVVADQYGLNPFTKEIYAFPDQQNGIVPVVGVDGWSRIINNHPQYDGMEFHFSETTIQLKGLSSPIFEWIECVIFRKDRTRPTVVREYLEEIYRPPFEKRGSNGSYQVKGPWQTHPRRFARHKVVIQAARMALGYTGIFDEDESERILESRKQHIVNSNESISFDVDDDNAVIEPPKKKAQILSDLAEADFCDDEEETVQIEQVQSSESVEHDAETVQDEQPEELDPTAYMETEFGEILLSDKKMIDQMIQFTVDTKSWKNTYDSFSERYEGDTLAYALDLLAIAQSES